MPEENHILHARGRVLEDLFFFEQDQALLKKKQLLKKMEHNFKTLSGISGISNEVLVRKLVELNIQVEVLATLSIIPLIEVAWADKKIDEKEREAILKGTESSGIFGGKIDRSLFEHWLRQQPPKGFLESWVYYMQGLCQLLSKSERQALKSDILKRARKVAEVSCSSLGLKSKISLRKENILLRLESAFQL